MLLRMRQENFKRTLSKRKSEKHFQEVWFTVSAVVLAVGTTIGVIVSALTRRLKCATKGIGNGFKTLGNKIRGILPRLISSIVGFIFKTAGSVTSFLGHGPDNGSRHILG